MPMSMILPPGRVASRRISRTVGQRGDCPTYIDGSLETRFGAGALEDGIDFAYGRACVRLCGVDASREVFREGQALLDGRGLS
jgi:hypothetical protein